MPKFFSRSFVFPAAFVLTAILCEATTQIVVADDVWRRVAGPLLDVSLSEGVQRLADGRVAELAVGRQFQDDGPAAGYSYQPSEEVLDAKTAVRKQLEIDDPRTSAAYLLIGGNGKFEAAVNGREAKLDAPTTVGNYWQQYALPSELLKAGLNEIVVRGTGKIYIARDDERPPQDSPPPNRSAKSSDGGATWDDAALGKKGPFDGEYYVRLFLEQHRRRGTITSPVIDVANLAESPLSTDFVATPSEKLASMRVRARAEVPPQTTLTLAYRSGSTLSVDAEHWSPWQSLGGLEATLENLRGRFVQVRLELTTDDPRRSPRVEELSLSSTEIARPAWTEQVRVVERPAGRIVRSSIPFVYESPSQPQLKKLREQFRLDDVTSGARTDWERIQKLAAWSAVRWQKRTGHLGQAYPKWDALEILAPHDDGTPVGGFCQQYNLVFLQACESYGIRGRAVSLGPGEFRDRIRSGHEVVELWSNDFAKWVHVDGDAARYYVDAESRTPLSLRELHDRQLCFFRERPFRAVEAVTLADTRPPWTSFADVPPFVELRLIPRSDFLARSQPLPLHQGMRGWSWPGHFAWTDADVLPARLYDERVTLPNNWDWTLNTVDLRLAATSTVGELAVDLDTETPGFTGYEATVDDRPPQSVTSSFRWKLHAGVNRLVVAAKNETTRGVPTTAVVELAE